MYIDMRTMKPDFSSLVLGHTMLRLVEPADANYIYSLRVNSQLNTFLSAAPESPQAQRDWINTYKTRESERLEHYFVICNIDRQPCGVVRLYDYSESSFCWGSWILDVNKSRYAAVESALLVYEVGFKRLGFPGCHFDVRLGNARVISFHQKMGAHMVKQDDLNMYFEITPAAISERSDVLMKIIGQNRK